MNVYSTGVCIKRFLFRRWRWWRFSTHSFTAYTGIQGNTGKVVSLHHYHSHKIGLNFRPLEKYWKKLQSLLNSKHTKKSKWIIWYNNILIGIWKLLLYINTKTVFSKIDTLKKKYFFFVLCLSFQFYTL